MFSPSEPESRIQARSLSYPDGEQAACSQDSDDSRNGQGERLSSVIFARSPREQAALRLTGPGVNSGYADPAHGSP
jgi:hypothetical protein